MKKSKKKAMKAYNKMLNEFIDDKKVVQIGREFIGESANLSGFILKNNPEFMLLQVEEVFQLDGYAIIPGDQYEFIRHDQIDKTINRILKKEGVVKESYGIDAKVDITSYPNLFKSLKKAGFAVTIWCEHEEEAQELIIGPITKVGDKSVSIQFLDATGMLHDSSTKVKYKDITLIRFGDRYSTLYHKYAKPFSFED